MDEKEYIGILEQCVGNRMEFSVETRLDPSQDINSWRADGSIKFSATRDGNNWGNVKLEVSTYDKNPSDAVATILAGAFYYADSEDFLRDIFNSILKAEGTEDGEDVKELTEDGE